MTAPTSTNTHTDTGMGRPVVDHQVADRTETSHPDRTPEVTSERSGEDLEQPIQTRDDELTAPALQAAARRAWLANPDLIGAELGARFGRSERWGRDRIAEARHTLTDETTAAPSNGNGKGNGSRAAATGSSGNGSRPQRQPQPTGSNPTAANGPARPAAARTGNGNRTAARSAATTAAGGAARRQPGRGLTLSLAVRLIVGAVAAAVSYGHMYSMALAAGEHLWLARAWPVTVDGLVVVAMRRDGAAGRWWLYVALMVSLASNVAAQYPDMVASYPPIRIAVAAWPALAFAGVHHLTHDRQHTPRFALRPETSGETAPETVRETSAPAR